MNFWQINFNTFQLLYLKSCLNNRIMNKSAYAFIGLVTLLTACGKTEKETPNGFKFTVVESGDGVLAKPSEIMVFDFVMKDSKDSVWQSTYTEEMPGYLMIADTAAIKRTCLPLVFTCKAQIVPAQ